MIIDVHQHFLAISPRLDENALDLWAKTVAGGFYSAHGRGARSERMDVSVEEIQRRLRACVPDPNGQKLRERMTQAEVDATITCVVDNVVRGASDESIMTLNRVCAELANKSEGRLIALAGIDPRRKAAPELFRQCVEEYGMKGLKWHPDHGYYPNSEEAYAVLKVAEELGVPLLTHTGPVAAGAMPGMPPGQVPRAKYAHPVLLDEVSQDFPGLKIIAAHMGGHFAWREWAALAQVRPNLYGDLAMWQFYAVANYECFCHDLREILDIAGADSVLFGSDDPFLTAVLPNEQFIQILRDLPQGAPPDIKFTEEEVAGILGGNAQKIFCL